MVSGIRKLCDLASIAASHGLEPNLGRLIFEDHIQFRLLKFIIRMSQWQRTVSRSNYS